MIKDIKSRSQHRIKIIAGQLTGLQKMIENEDYCVDILTQSLAVQRSLRSLNKLILENHLQTHVAHDLASGDVKTKEKALKELLDLYELSNVRGK
jgi:DNA-binding FrmR family transcriptional regulator